MSDNKTRPTSSSVNEFIEAVENETRRRDSYILLDLFEKITGQPPVLWGDSVIDFGRYHYQYDSGREGDMLIAGFSPRKRSLSIYNTGHKRQQELLKKPGIHKIGGSFLYINKLSDINLEVLSDLIRTGYDHMNTKYNS